MGKLSDHVVAMRNMHGANVAVGWFAENRYADGTPVAQVAAWNEFGTTRTVGDGTVERIPPRPLLRLSAAAAQSKISSVAGKLSDRVLSGRLSPEQAMGQIGGVALEAISDTLQPGTLAPNADSTAAAKGFNVPLVHHGTLSSTVQSQVNYDGDPRK